MHDSVPYSQKIWRELNLVVLVLAVYITTAKLKSSYSHIIIIRMTTPYWTAKFKYANILAIAILGSTTKFNSCQNFRLYGNNYNSTSTYCEPCIFHCCSSRRPIPRRKNLYYHKSVKVVNCYDTSRVWFIGHIFNVLFWLSLALMLD